MVAHNKSTHFQKWLSLFVTFAVVFSALTIPISAGGGKSSLLRLSAIGWQKDYDWTGTSTSEVKDGTLILHNLDGNHFTLTRVIPVKPDTYYSFSALVRMEGYQETENAPSGASVRFDKASDVSAYTNDYVTSTSWTESKVIFKSPANQTTMNVSVAVGCYGATCKGTAYFKDFEVEELDSKAGKDNHWNILGLVYRNIDSPEWKNSFTDEEVNHSKAIFQQYPTAIKTWSDSRMIIDNVDVEVIDTPVMTVSGGAGELVTGQDIDIDSYLEGKDYQLIVVYAPLAGYSKASEWIGLGGTWYTYRGHNIYYLTINLIDMETEHHSYMGIEFDNNLGTLLHEHLHCVEANSSIFNGWGGFTPVHNNADHGYTDDQKHGWVDWYSDLMRDRGLNGKGFKPESFLVDHYSPNTREETVWQNPFTDIGIASPSYNAIRFVYEHGLFNGVSATEFAPDKSMTRAMFVTVLGRFSGVDVSQYSTVTFKDVQARQWYTPYVAWAQRNGIVTGYNEETFGVNDTVTIEQAVVILERYAKSIGMSTATSAGLGQYQDGGSVAAWAEDGMKFVVGRGLYQGGARKLNPKENASRSQVAEMLTNLAFVLK